MKTGEVYCWLDQGPAIGLAPCEIPDPVPMGKEQEYSEDPDAWQTESGWTISLLMTGEVLDVHEDTLNLGF